MNIGMVLDGNYPSDIRVRKEAETLAKHHKVFILCVKNEGEDVVEEINGVSIHRLISYKNVKHRGIIDVLNSINFIHPYFYKKLPLFIEKNSISALHIHDLPLARTGYILSKKYKIKTVLDLHENYPAALRTWFVWRKNPIIRLKNKLFFSYNRWRKYEAEILVKFDKLIAVVDEMKDRLIKQHQIDKDTIIVVPNAEKKEFAGNFKKDDVNFFDDSYKNKFIISYVGGFGPHRGLHTAIEGIKFIKEKIPNVILVLVGPAKKDVVLYLEELISINNMQENVIIKKAEPFKNVVRIMKNSNVNIIPHISNEHTQSAVPHKFYQILLSGKPLLVSDCAPMKRMILKDDIGTVFKAEDPKSFAMSILEIYNNYDNSTNKAKRGKELALKGELNWEYASEGLVKLYEQL